MRNAKNNKFHIHAYLNSVHGIDMHIIEQTKTLNMINDAKKN